MPAAKKNCKITFNLLPIHQSQTKVIEIRNLFLRMNSIHFNILTPVSARDQLNRSSFTENVCSGTGAIQQKNTTKWVMSVQKDLFPA